MDSIAVNQRSKLNTIIRVLVVDDSAYVRKVVREILTGSPVIEVVGIAGDGIEALRLAASLKPDVVISDLMMPELDGVGFVREQMLRKPIPILVMSSVDENSLETIAALDAGAIDFVQKPTALAVEKIYSMRSELIEKIKMAAAAQPRPVAMVSDVQAVSQESRISASRTSNRFDIVVIGISTGGPQALRYMIPQLPKYFPIPIVVVLHMPIGYTAMYAERLDQIAELDFREAKEGDAPLPGTVLLAPAGKHLTFSRSADGQVKIKLGYNPDSMPHRPSVDVLFQSAAETFGDRTLGIVMTGMGSDGKAGAAWIKARGGTIFTESEETCVVYGMPNTVVEAGLSDKIVRLELMSQAIQEVS